MTFARFCSKTNAKDGFYFGNHLNNSKSDPNQLKGTVALQMKMQMKLNQQLIMTPQLQQAIKLLQLSHTELEELIDQTLVENPVLEEGMDIDSFPNRETPASEENSETPEVASGTEDFFKGGLWSLSASTSVETSFTESSLSSVDGIGGT